MCLISLVGAVTLFLKKETLDRLLLPMVAFSAGSLIGGAFFHMIPEAVDKTGSQQTVYLWVVLGFSFFLLVEQFLHWHHCHQADASCHKQRPLGYMILIGDSIHNFIGGVAVGGTFLIDIRLGITTWLAAAAHEIPQEMGDFGVLLHGGWPKKKALIMNFLSATTFLLGGLLAYFLSFSTYIYLLIPFAAGNFLYIGASDLIPEVNKDRSLRKGLLHTVCFGLGVGMLLALRRLFEG